MNTSNKNISEIDDFFKKIQSAFVSVADIALKKNFRNKNNLKKRKQQKWNNLDRHQMQKRLNQLGRIVMRK